MSNRNLDVLFVKPNNSSKIYQGLSTNYSAIETPTWSLLLAESCRSIGYDVAIMDTCAENLSDEESIERIKSLNPRLVCFVVYGQNVNAGTVNMSGAVRLSKAIKNFGVETPICFAWIRLGFITIQGEASRPLQVPDVACKLYRRG